MTESGCSTRYAEAGGERDDRSVMPRRGRDAERRVRGAGRSLVLLMMAVLMGLSAGGPGGRVARRRLGPAPTSPRVKAWPRREPAGWPSFLIGASYQGPAARSWRGDYWAWWADDLFDAQLVSEDFARASAAGLNTLRIFVQLEFLREIRDDNWTKLDTVMNLADQHGLRLIVTLGDYDEPRVAPWQPSTARSARGSPAARRSWPSTCATSRRSGCSSPRCTRTIRSRPC